MAQNLLPVKNAFAADGAKRAGQLLALAQLCDELAAKYFAEGFNSGGTNPIADSDLVSPNDYLTAGIISNVITQAQLMSSTFSASVRNVLRQAIAEAQPPNLR